MVRATESDPEDLAVRLTQLTCPLQQFSTKVSAVPRAPFSGQPSSDTVHIWLTLLPQGSGPCLWSSQTLIQQCFRRRASCNRKGRVSVLGTSNNPFLHSRECIVNGHMVSGSLSAPIPNYYSIIPSALSLGPAVIHLLIKLLLFGISSPCSHDDLNTMEEK